MEIGMVALAWAHVFSGTYIVYPWCRAVPPAGTIDLADYPRYFLLPSMTTKEWHRFGMEWREHVVLMLAKQWDLWDLAMTRVSVAVFALLAVGFALTFPPLTGLRPGK